MQNFTPNLIAYAALALWPIVSLYLFARRPAAEALIWTILGGSLLLPVGTSVKLEMVPAFDKESIPCLAALVGVSFARLRPSPGRSWFSPAGLLLIVLMLSPLATSALNNDVIVVSQELTLPGVGSYDAISAGLRQIIVILVPFALGRRVLGNPEDNVKVLRILTIAGLVYTLPMLFELRFSPQLHAWIYGYFPHSFEQQMRDGGFRPVVFLGHGLLVAFFMMTAVLASCALWRARIRVVRLSPSKVSAWLGAVLLLCKTMGAFLYALTLAPLILLAKPRTQVRVAMVLATIALAYPLLRTAHLVPTNFLLDAAGRASAERATSLKVRFDNEEMLLAHASERPWFGWGRYGRGRVYDEYGKDISITDGHWIITMGTFGLVGFIAEFGLLALPVFRAISGIANAPNTRDRICVAALALILAAGIIDQLPNASIGPWSWLLSGALLGNCEWLQKARHRARKRLSAGLIGQPASSIGHRQGQEGARGTTGVPAPAP